jgi:translation initiation factor IF-1
VIFEKINMATDKENLVMGRVTECLPNALFRVQIEGGKETLAYLAGKMRIHKIKVLVGDKVTLLPEPTGGKARIVKRN